MDICSLLEFLELFWLAFEIVRYFIHRPKKKELANAVESISQRLLQLEKSLPEKSDKD
jgi:hypothetical protein